MNNTENEEFKRLKEVLLNHLSSQMFSKPKILIVDNENTKNRLEEVFKYDIQEISKYREEDLFSMKIPDLKVFKICTNIEYLNLNEVIKINSEKN